MFESKANNILNIVLGQGLYIYKHKNSQASLPQKVEAFKVEGKRKKGAIPVVRSKEDLLTPNGVKGYVITSLESLTEDVDALSHWCPNVFNYLTYTDDQRRYIKGHEEKNLQQINTFVVDIDSKRQSYTDILSAAVEHSIGAPTMVLETPKGFQVYFVLETPLFISNKNDFRGLKVAKRISENIKLSLAKVLHGVDVSCNDFGFFRIPKKENIRWFSEECAFDFGSLIAWSRRQDDDRGRGLFVVSQEKRENDVTETAWFRELLRTQDVKGTSGQLGRDNLMFTLALACYSAGKGSDEALDLLDEYNSRLKSPVRHTEVEKIVRSAYKGRFKGASKTYIKELLDAWGIKKDVKIETPRSGWHKFKKEREDRVRSHYEEWEEDLLTYINEMTQLDRPVHWTTQSEICEEIGIPRSTLNEVIRQSTKIMVKRIGKGRAAKTGLTSVAVLLQCALSYQKTHRLQYIINLELFLTEKENETAIGELQDHLDIYTRLQDTRRGPKERANSS